MKNSTLCYIEKDGCYLMLHRVKKENDINRDKWIGIGGRFEEGESPEDCIIREMWEETGLAPTRFGGDELSYRGIVTFVTGSGEGEYMHLFTCRSFTGEISECDEGMLEWIKKDKLLGLDIWEGDKIFLRLIDDESYPFFSLKLTYDGSRLTEAVLNGEIIVKQPDGEQ